MKVKILNIIWFLGLMFLGVELQAQQDITIEEATEMALKNNYLIKSKDIEIQVVEALKPTANELPKLEVELQLGQYNSPKFDQAIAVSQRIPFPTLFQAKRNLISEQVKGKEIEKEISEIEIIQQVNTYFYQIEYLQFNQNQLAKLDSLYADFIRIATVRYKAGDIKKIEINTAETQRGEITLFLNQNQTYLVNAYENLKTLLQTKDSIKIRSINAYTPLQLSSIIDSTNLSQHPALRAFQQEIAIANQNKSVQKSTSLPEFTLGYTNQSLIGMQNFDDGERYVDAAHRFSFVNVGVAIPLSFGATKARMKSLDYEIELAKSNAQLLESKLKNQLETEINQYQQAVLKYNYYLNQAVPNAQKITNAAQLGYKTGEISYVEYLFALQTATQIQLKYLESIQQVNQSVIIINSIINPTYEN